MVNGTLETRQVTAVYSNALFENSLNRKLAYMIELTQNASEE